VLLVGVACAGAVAEEAVRLQRVASTGEAAPGGGVFDRFGAEAAPIVAPVNARGDVVFFATLGRGNSTEGLFRWSRGRAVAVAREGDRVGSVGTLSGFGRHPVPALGDDGTVVFAAAIAGGRAVEGLFVARNGTVRPVALAGAQAPGNAGVLATLDAPAINARGDIVFLAGLRRGRETLEAVFIASGGRLRKVVAQGDPAPSGGSFAAFGPPIIDRDGAVAFGAAIEGRSVPGGIFIWKADQLRMVLGAGDESPIGGIFAKFSERIGSATKERSSSTASSRARRRPPAFSPSATVALRRSRAWATRPRAAASIPTSDCGPWSARRGPSPSPRRWTAGRARSSRCALPPAGRVAWSASATACLAARASRRSACCRS
jgi:hypothetical protein